MTRIRHHPSFTNLCFMWRVKAFVRQLAGSPLYLNNTNLSLSKLFSLYTSHHSRNPRKRSKSEHFSLQARPQFTIPVMYIKFITEERVIQRLKCIIMKVQRNPGDMWRPQKPVIHNDQRRCQKTDHKYRKHSDVTYKG